MAEGQDTFYPQAQSSSFYNRDFVGEVMKRDVPIKYSGQTEGESICNERAMFMDVIEVDYSPKFTTNIISGAEMKHKYGYYFDYDPVTDRFRLIIGEKEIFFSMENNLYTYDPTEDYDIVIVHTTMITKAQEQKAEDAKDLMQRLGYPSPQRMVAALREGALVNAGLSPEDVRRADVIFGRPYPYLAGKTVWRDPSLPPSIKAEMLPESNLEGYTDLMYLCNKKITILTTVYKPIDLVISSVLDGTGKEEKKKAFSNQIGVLKGEPDL